MPLETFLAGPDTSASRSTTTSIFSKFSSPLSKRSRTVFDFSIDPDEPSRLYKPGEIVKGQIVLSALKGFDITHLVIALHGYAKVFKHQQEGQSSREELVNGKGTRGFEYHGNGLASLFQDEQTLCGSGFLKKQVYKFGFELQFPTKGLPSALDFERGTISYMISATVTRPTTITPTSTKTHSIRFRDCIDIENMYTPKTRMISLEPISRRGRMKKVKTSSSTSTHDASTRGILARQTPRTSSFDKESAISGNPPLSPAPSEDTIATKATTSTGSFQILEPNPSNKKHSPQTSDTRSGETSLSAHTITATTELPRYGALAGDMVPIRVSVTHTKPQARGVIIATLYRLGRIDMHPVLPLASKGRDKKKEYEDVYPRSRTGLGGLYFANGSPSSVFRKDLSQSSTMMIVNPTTMTADVKTSIKVPEDAFPTISNVPGGMISFTYHVEVIIDLTGKLGESRFFPSLTNNGPTFSTGTDNGNQITSEWANSILDTTSLRRIKSVVTFELPLVVGTMDTRRARQSQKLAAQEYQEYENYDPSGAAQGWQGDAYGPDYYDYSGYDGYYYDEYGNPLYDEWYEYPREDNGTEPLPEFVPPPEPPEEVDEKTRLRRQEELLMPSRPPDTGESSSSTQASVPTAPFFPDDGDDSVTPIASTENRVIMAPCVSRASARSVETIVPHNSTPPPALSEGERVHQTDDKQELERRRLLAQASAPPGEDVGGSASTAPSAPPATAPIIDDDEEYIARALNNHQLNHDHAESDHLPQYWR